uniref:Uncharacterized protein n=1 Tax=Anguilla anguilla TaxID=7936 RepID=A0A0E9QVJ0_ANGAN
MHHFSVFCSMSSYCLHSLTLKNKTI